MFFNKKARNSQMKILIKKFFCREHALPSLHEALVACSCYKRFHLPFGFCWGRNDSTHSQVDNHLAVVFICVDYTIKS